MPWFESQQARSKNHYSCGRTLKRSLLLQSEAKEAPTEEALLLKHENFKIRFYEQVRTH